jgi:hypothetical protein
VLLLHASSEAAVAGELVRVWQPSIPAAVIFPVSVTEGNQADFANLPAGLLVGSSAYKRPLVLAGVCGAEDAALRLGFDRRLPQCAGVLAAGRVVPPLGPLAMRSADRMLRIRLIWEVSEATNWAVALGELLSWYRAAGLDAQGGVLEPVGNTQADECGLLAGPDPYGPHLSGRTGRYSNGRAAAAGRCSRTPSVWAPRSVILARSLNFNAFRIGNCQ